MNQVVTEAIVLKRTNFGEADRILTVLTPNHGRVRVIAKASRKVKSKLAGGIELFSICEFTYVVGKSEIYTLTSSRLKTHFNKIATGIDRTMYGYEILKLINKTVEDNAGPEYFDLLQETLNALNRLDLAIPLIDLWFSAQLLKLSGHAPNLKTDSTGEKLVQGSTYNFDIDKMVFVKKKNGNYSPSQIKLLRLAFGLDIPIKLLQVRDIDNVLLSSLGLIKNIQNNIRH